jgi:cytochrome c oxidase subunit 2
MSWKLLLISAQASGQSFMPPVVSDIGGQINNLYSFLLWTSFIGCAILIGGMIFFVLKYRRKTATDKVPYISHNTFLEFLWSFIPLVLFLAVFVWGWVIYHQMRKMPENALEVHVVGRQWAWEFIYKSGKVSQELYVPVNTPVKLIMTSKDVLHSFYIPTLRIKQDVVPGTYSALTFNAQKLGNFHVFCTEYCGTVHSGMLTKLNVLPMSDYEAWLQENDDALSLLEKGQKYAQTKGCVACHSIDGRVGVGPSWKGNFGSEREMTDGLKVISDENYLRESIVNPNAKVVKGFAKGVMPSYQGQLTEDQLTALIEYIKTLK